MSASLLFAVLLAATAPAEKGQLFKVYQQYTAAIDAEDLKAARQYLSAGKRAAIEKMNADDALSAISTLSPKEHLELHKEVIDGDDATLIVTAEVAENVGVGHIQFVRENGQWKILSELWDIGGDPDQPPGDVPQPKTEEQRAAIRKLRERGFPAPSADFMAMVAGQGDLEAVKLFLQAGYSADATSNNSPAILLAAGSGHRDVVALLIKEGADVNAQDEIHTTALMRAADHCGSTEIVRMLLAAGAKTDVKNDGGTTALQLAEWSECKENADLIRAASH